MDAEIAQTLGNVTITGDNQKSQQHKNVELDPIVIQLGEGDKRLTVNSLEELQNLLTSRKLENSNIVSAVELVADSAKNDTARKKCTNVELICYLLDLLSCNDNAVLLQASRALGNICYDNDEAREIVMNHQGVEKLISLLKMLLSEPDVSKSACLQSVASGCLLNLTDTIEEIQEQAIRGGAIDLFLQYLEKCYENEDISSHCLLILNCLADCEHGKTELMQKSSIKSLMNILDKLSSNDLMDSLLELLENLAENDPARLNMAELGMGEAMLQLIENCQQGKWNEASQHILKLACDLLILILTGDSSMSLLYQNGKGSVYQKAKCWLSSDDCVMQVAGALAAGNFARKDSYCIQMVDDHISESLLALLEKHYGKEGDIRLQHAVLSALRNLAIPVQNKAVLVSQGVIEKLLPLISVDTYPVIFKLLGTLRMLLDKQEEAAVTLGENTTFLQRVIEWCNTDDHPGVKGESTRMLAWLVKNSVNPSVMKNIVKENGTCHLIEMITSEYTLMQNEALVSLTLIASTVPDQAKEAFEQDILTNILCQCLKSTETSSTVIQNIFNLITVLVNAGIKGSLAENAEVKSAILQIAENNEELARQAKDLIQFMELH